SSLSDEVADLRVEDDRRESKGFTLIEILVATSIFVGVVVIAIGSFSASTGVQRRTENIREVGQTGRYALEKISRDIRIAKGGGTYRRGLNNDSVEGFFILADNNRLIDSDLNSQATQGHKLVIFLTDPDNTVSANIYRRSSTGVLQVQTIRNATLIDADDDIDDDAAYTDIIDGTKVNIANTNDFSINGYRPPQDNPARQPYLVINLAIQSRNLARSVSGAQYDKVSLKTTVDWRSYE
ncbi:MAG TPA: hypothetical protein DEF27_03975, partial [Oscillatoriales bacterium UBA8482]|nr:hypothetical protein [Oscillatoriales bacterium UBA8482]